MFEDFHIVDFKYIARRRKDKEACSDPLFYGYNYSNIRDVTPTNLTNKKVK